jgi:hypothetical protein
VSHPFRFVLMLSLAVFITAAYSPATFADKKNNNSSNSDDDDNKDKGKNNQNNNGRHGRDRSDNNSSNNNSSKSNQFPQFQNPQGNYKKQKDSDNGQQYNSSDKQSSSKSSSQVIINNNTIQNGQFQKSPQGQNFSKQQFPNGQKPNNIPQNVQLQGVQNKPDWIKQDHHDHKDVKNFVVKFGGPEPFSNKWYKDHPKAWHYDHHDHNDTWKYVTAASLVGFLGWEAYHTHGPVVVYQPVPYDALWVTRPGVIIDPSRGEWMPLGQYTLMLGPGDDSTRMLDLAVDRFGHIRGSYYDMVSGVAHNVAGIVDPRTQYAQWSLESNRDLTFYTPMGEMMQPQGLVYVQLPSGERQQWQLIRNMGG